MNTESKKRVKSRKTVARRRPKPITWDEYNSDFAGHHPQDLIELALIIGNNEHIFNFPGSITRIELFNYDNATKHPRIYMFLDEKALSARDIEALGRFTV